MINLLLNIYVHIKLKVYNFYINVCLVINIPNYYGAILSDEMGLGKSFTSIALLWTLLRTSNVPKNMRINKAIIVCPSSLTTNWRKEIQRWIGNERIKPVILNSSLSKAQQSDKIKEYLNINHLSVLIISYEMLRSNINSIKLINKAKYSKTEGLIIADEGHRLKNSTGNKTIQALNSIRWKKTININWYTYTK